MSRDFAHFTRLNNPLTHYHPMQVQTAREEGSESTARFRKEAREASEALRVAQVGPGPFRDYSTYP